ncbi:hypothetical protein [Luteimonas sp. MC1750]|uniref:hypothetical protein n=1 Tax=Luteimonas sp. MC1750 TaxID=2799326 RepID=UPI0018F0D468|nr:hypothetical protein [Luteimonas sp. MC1750]MBJ6983693.1 hypothetical protein [Luteimonas sp. MC1750]QQO06531.1 hypothetical protein JGR68_03545 [Luteimonas sp. MC1750]
MNQGDKHSGDDAPAGGVERDKVDGAKRLESDAAAGAKGAADRAGGVRRQDGPEPYDDVEPSAGRRDPVDDMPGVPGQSGYEENGPGRGDYPGRGRGESTQPRRVEDGELDARSRWRDADRDERSDRWKDDPDQGGDASP